MKKLLQGNEAIAQGAIKAGMGFYAGYPITPASEILHELVKYKANVVQMEDEIASINACIGASLAGAKTMTATSGPGFSLMQEAIGYAHMAEVPLVVVDVQRVGPSTGMPTMPAQGDIIQCAHGSHGDYFPIVLYPNSVSELFRFTVEAFNAAEESLSPVILLSDGFISHLYETVEIDDIDIKKVNRKREPLGKGTRHWTGLTAQDGIPKASDPEVHIAIVERLRNKQKNAAKRYNYYEYKENKKSKKLIVSFGAVSRLAYHFKNRYALFRPIRIYPVVEELRDIADKYDEIIVMEMNAGQYRNEVERLIKRDTKFIGLLGGRLSLADLKRRL